MDGLIAELLSPYHRKVLEEHGGADLAVMLEGLGRFRLNVFRQNLAHAMVFRVVRSRIPSIEELMLPLALKKFPLEPRGLILIAGATSSGKSTTLAAMIDHVNNTKAKHIISIEDPIEFLHRENLCIVNQREIGHDSPSFVEALRYVVRQDPDLIAIGEMRDSETFQIAISAAETGRLVISTIHARNVHQTFDRILGFFHADVREQVMIQLSFNLVSIACQRLTRRRDGKGMVPAVEILVNTPTVSKLVREQRLERLPAVIQGGHEDGMQTFNQALLKLYQESLIDQEEALRMSDNPQALTMNMKGIFLDETAGGIIGEKAPT